MRESATQIVQFTQLLMRNAASNFEEDEILGALDYYAAELAEVEVGNSIAGVTSATYYLPRFFEITSLAIPPLSTAEDLNLANGRLEINGIDSGEGILVYGFAHDPYAAAADLLELNMIQGAQTGAYGTRQTGRHKIVSISTSSTLTLIDNLRAKSPNSDSGGYIGTFLRDDFYA